MTKLKIVLLSEKSILPTQATTGSAGWDLYSPEGYHLMSSGVVMVKTGIKLGIPKGYYVSIVPRSSMGKKGVIIPNAPGTIDSDYTGEICVMLHNLTVLPVSINPGDRIAQMILHKYEPIDFEIVDVIEETSRGSGGFGSTGK